MADSARKCCDVSAISSPFLKHSSFKRYEFNPRQKTDGQALRFQACGDFKLSIPLKCVSAGGREGSAFAEVISGCILAGFRSPTGGNGDAKTPFGGLATIQEARAALLAHLTASEAGPRAPAAEKANLIIPVHWPGGPLD